MTFLDTRVQRIEGNTSRRSPGEAVAADLWNECVLYCRVAANLQICLTVIGAQSFMYRCLIIERRRFPDADAYRSVP